jgi:predicted nucleotidyltransferase
MSINSKLTIFAARELVLARDANERFRIEVSISRLKTKLKQKFLRDIKNFILFGSYTRNTILPRKYYPNSDIDLMVVFNSTNGLKTPETYRSNLIEVLDAAYPNSISQKDFPAVKLELNHIKFDIVPAYTEEYIFRLGQYYYIPDSHNRWRTTKPNDLNESLAQKNQASGNNILRNTIRLCKHWNAAFDYPFDSYEMEEEILGLGYWSNKDLYGRFLSTINDIAGDFSGVRQALDYIEKYKGGWLNESNEEKQLLWLQKLLPGLT